MFNNKTAGFRIFFYASVVIIGIFVFFPLYWMINTSFKLPKDVLSLSIVPLKPTIKNFVSVITNLTVMRYFANSLFVSFVSSILATAISAYAGYSLSRFRYRGRKTILLLFLASRIFPQAVLLLSIYTMMKHLKLTDNYLSLILSFVTFTIPIGTWTLKSFFDQIPYAISESAKIDGASHATIMHRIIFPLAIPGIASTLIYGFVWSWNDMLYSLTLITSPARRTLAPGLILTYLGEFQSNWGNMMAASILVSIPVALLFIFCQKLFIEGLTSGAVKG